MDSVTFFATMSRGQYREGVSPEKSDHCIFIAPFTSAITRDRLQGNQEALTLELSHLQEGGGLRVRQEGNNIFLEEFPSGQFSGFLQEQSVQHLGQVFLYALRYKMEALSLQLEQCTGEMKRMEEQLEACTDNKGTYEILEFRRKYVEFGVMILAMKEILTRIDKGYYPMQMQNSYVLQGQVLLEFGFLESRYDLVKGSLIRDLDTYTSVINNNINRNARFLSIISLAGVSMNFVFGSFLATNPVVGILGGVVIGGLSLGAAVRYHAGNRRNAPMVISQGKTPVEKLEEYAAVAEK